MPSAELQLPVRLLAGGGPATPDPRVLRALATPLIGQFDLAFTEIMDDVVQLARQTFLTSNPNCFAISALASGGVEAVVNSLLDDGDAVLITGCPSAQDGTRLDGYATRIAQIVQCCGGVPTGNPAHATHARLNIVPLIDPDSGVRTDIERLASGDVPVLVDATMALGACEVRVDDWHIDVCVAGVDHGIGAPAGMSLVTYTPAIQQRMEARKTPPRTSYLDLLQLQAYWSSERLNHHTAPTSLVYGLREALRLVHLEGLEARWQRHADTSLSLRDGLAALSAVERVTGDLPYSIVHLHDSVDESHARKRLIDEYGVHVTHVGPRTWRVGLLAFDARPETVNLVVAAFQKVLAA